jgi:hypothetical protein
MGMAMIATITRTSRETMAMDTRFFLPARVYRPPVLLLPTASILAYKSALCTRCAIGILSPGYKTHLAHEDAWSKPAFM